ncbi:MAG: hypothetical protein ACAH11_06240 [Sphingomonas sp.]
MSDDVSIYGDDGREYHSRFDLGLEMAAMESIKWLILGHLLFLAGLALALLMRLEMAPVWATPLFGLPLLWAGRHHRQWARAFVFLIGFTAIHYLAIWATKESYSPAANPQLLGDALVSGFYGGAIGAVGGFGLCAVFRQLRDGVPTLIFATFGSLLLAGVGSLGVYLFLNTGGPARGFADGFVQMVWIYSPWQLLFAYFLAKTLEPIDE